MSTFVLEYGNNILDLNDYAHTGIYCSSKDVGAPTVREVSTDFPSIDLVDDQTNSLSLRVVTVSGWLISNMAGSRSTAWDRMVPFLDPAIRATLLYAYDNDVAPRVLTGLRGAQWSFGQRIPQGIPFQVQWKAQPVALNPSVMTETIYPYSALTGGRTYDKHFDVTYAMGSTGFVGSVPTVIINGTYKTWGKYRIFGPCTNPDIMVLNPVTGDRLSEVAFSSLTITAGNWVDVDTEQRTVYQNGDPGSSRYSNLDFANTLWKPLPAQATIQIAYTVSTGTVPTLVLMSWQEAFL
jgi:hypothetical protein